MKSKYLVVDALFLILTGFLTIGYVGAEEKRNLLKNPSFEENEGLGNKKIFSWVTYGNVVYEVYDKEVHSGKFSVKFWWDGGMYQQVPVIPKLEYQISAWLLNSGKEPLDVKGTKYAVVKLKFISKKNEVIDIIESEKFDCKYEVGEWRKVEVKGIAPEDASFARAEIVFVGGTGAGVICIDDVSLELIKKKDKEKKKKIKEE